MGRKTRTNPEKSSAAKAVPAGTKSRELIAFLFLTVVLAPAIAVAVVGGYGFSIWMYQLMVGPPGAH